MTERLCKTCAHYDEDEGVCRHSPPSPRTPHEFILIGMLQAIAFAQLKLAGFAPGSPDMDWPLDKDVWGEVTEYYKPAPWPHVEKEDWCGQWKESS